ncbi:MAG: hypothetical protein GC204_17765 [Chloroflexi bacterium]|nr:hypothetical protein [Chloroflexota bacterium]
MRRHLIILLITTVLVRGWMMVSYPMSGTDDNQAAERYLINQVLHGNLLIGNLRYQTGYPFAIAPVFALARPFGQFDDRIILLVQVALSATIPFMVYDILRKRRTPHEALIVALFVLLDPFGLQWAHFYLPEWLIACCLIFAFWLLERGRWSLRIIALVGVVLGLSCVMRWNMIPLVGLLGLLFFALRSYSLRRRALMFITLGVTSVTVVGLYLVLIQYPSTGTIRPSCISGINLLEDVGVKGLPLDASNGVQSAYLADLLAHPAPQQIMFLGDSYARWQQPDAWGTPEEQAQFLNGTTSHGYPMSTTTLSYYLGPCPVDDLLRGVYFETIASNPLRWIGETLRFTADVLVQIPISSGSGYRILDLPTYDSLTFIGNSTLGFQKSTGGYYTGQWVWKPGIAMFSAVFPVINLLKFLIFPTLIWVFFSRDWFYATAALLLLAAALSLSIVDAPEARIYAAIYPLWPILIGGMVAALLRRWRHI